MLLQEVMRDNIPQWLKLAAEAEPIFQGQMVDSEKFRDYIKSKIETKEAFMALARENDNALMGIIRILTN